MTYLLFDEGQHTYRDVLLWNEFFKSYASFDNYRVIIFCSYGSAMIRPVNYDGGAPMNLHPRSRVSLVPNTELEDGFEPIGLLFSRTEFDEVVERKTEQALDRDLQDQIFWWTKGHAGAVTAILCITDIIAQHAQRNEPLNLNSFLEACPLEKFYNELSQSGGWTRGLPTSRDLQTTGVADMFCHLLQNGSIEGTSPSDVIQFCHKSGWIHSTPVTISDQVYVFPSPLHRLYMEWKLLPSSTTAPYDTLLDISIAVIQAFQPSQLSCPPRRIGDAGADRPPEAAYQDEFYRSLFQVTGGCVRISSEYSSAKGTRSGCIDFFIPSKKWGIGLLRDGNNIQEHWSRFLEHDAYGKWLEFSDMMDYIVLDFRSTRPQKSYDPTVQHQTDIKRSFEGIEKLYYVVFVNNHFNHVEILNNNLEKVTGFALTGHH